MISQFFGSFF
jgi:hypothetical protein